MAKDPEVRFANSETARDINRRVVLNLIRTRQPVSRADLARYSGMQRSTVSLITGQLIEEKWVIEGAMGHLPRGRKPRYLRLNSSRAGVIGVDIRPGGTRLAVADLNARFLAQETMPTSPDASAFERDLCRRVTAMIASRPEVSLEGVGVTLPGCVDLARRRLAYSANLGWRAVDLKTPLERATGLPVELENAANACALAESWFGTAAPGERDLAVVTVSEGIGTGILADGRLLRGAFGRAGEFGHITLESEGPPCSCGNRGCWELYASNSAAIRYYAGGATPEPSFEDVLALAEQGDRRAGEALDRMAYYLGVGMASLVTAIGPAVVMVVGEISRAWPRVGPVVERVVAERALLGQAPRILALDDSRQPRLRGTVALLMQKYFALPSGYMNGKGDA